MAKTFNLGSLANVLTVSGTAPQLLTAPAQFDNSNGLASTSWVNNVGLQISGQVNASGATTLTAASASGKLVYCFGTGGFTITLPAASTMRAGAIISLFSAASSNVTVSRAGSDVIQFNSITGTSMVITSGSSLNLYCDGSSTWVPVGGSAAIAYSAGFGASLGSNSYQKFPSGMILQSGQFSCPANSTSTVTLPVAFSTLFNCVTVSVGNNVSTLSASPFMEALPIDLTSFSIRNFYTGSSLRAYFICTGY